MNLIKRISLFSLALIMAFFAFKPAPTQSITFEEIQQAQSGIVAGANTYPETVITSSWNTTIIVKVQPLEYNPSTKKWNYKISWNRKKNTVGSIYANGIKLAASANKTGSANIQLTASSRAKIEFYSQTNKKGTLLVRKYFNVKNSLSNTGNSTILQPLFAGHNKLNADRINIVAIGVGDESLEDFRIVAQKAFTFNGSPRYVATSIISNGITTNNTSTEWGVFAIEPFKSSKNKFNLWYIPKIFTTIEEQQAREWYKTLNGVLPIYFVSNDSRNEVYGSSYAN